MTKERMISEEAQSIANKIDEMRTGLGRAPAYKELAGLFPVRALDTVLSADEVAIIGSAIAGRQISTDYIKRLRLAGRLTAKQISPRAYIYRLKDMLLVEFRAPYAHKPTGRPPKRR